MSDIVERLRDETRNFTSITLDAVQAADTIESLRQQLAEREKLINMTYKVQTDLRQQLAAADQDNKALSFNSQGMLAKLRQQLAESQEDSRQQRAATKALMKGQDDLQQQLAETQEELRVCQQEAIGHREAATESQARGDAIRDAAINLLVLVADADAVKVLGAAIKEYDKHDSTALQAGKAGGVP
jgi:regulator of replication initiation timing